jgi:hypothetical protein
MSDAERTLDMALARINARLLRHHEWAALCTMVLALAVAVLTLKASGSWVVAIPGTLAAGIAGFVCADRFWLQPVRRSAGVVLSDLLDAGRESRQRLAPFPVLMHLSTDAGAVDRPAPVPERHARTR